MPSKNLRSLFQKPRLVLDRIDPSHADQNVATANFWKSCASTITTIFLILSHRYSVWLHHDAFRWKLFLPQRRLAWIAGNDRIRIRQQPMRPEKQPKKLAPLPASCH